MAKTVCSTIQQSLAWCQGTPELPGIKRRIYYISKDQIVAWPSLTYDALGRLTSAAYTGSFVLAADATWKFIDILTDKSQLTSEGRVPQPDAAQQTRGRPSQCGRGGFGPVCIRQQQRLRLSR